MDCLPLGFCTWRPRARCCTSGTREDPEEERVPRLCAGKSANPIPIKGRSLAWGFLDHSVDKFGPLSPVKVNLS